MEIKQVVDMASPSANVAMRHTHHLMSHLLAGGASSVSAAACVWLLLHGFNGIRPTLKRRLFFRQMRHLAVADVLSGLGAATLQFFPMLITLPKPFCLYIMPITYTMVQGLGEYASLLIGSHIALAFAAVTCRHFKLLRMIESTLRFIWPLAVCLVLVDQFSNMEIFDDSMKQCHISPNKVIPVVGCIAVGVTTLSYLLTYWHTCMNQTTGKVITSVWRRTSFYLLAMLGTTGPYIVSQITGLCFLDSDSSQTQLWNVTSIVVYTLYKLNGLCNVLIYAVQSPYFKQPLKFGDGAVNNVPHSTSDIVPDQSGIAAGTRLSRHPGPACSYDSGGSPTPSPRRPSKMAYAFSVYFCEQESVVLFNATEGSVGDITSSFFTH